LAGANFQWRGASYRLDSSTWLFWNNARLIRLPGKEGVLRMTPDEPLFVQLAVKAGFECEKNLLDPELVPACHSYLEQNGHHVWTVQEAVQIVREDSDTDLSAYLLEGLIHWFFLIKF
jgi:hypothetical protein